MATRVKRLAVGVVALAVIGGGTASAQTATTLGTFASPASAPAEQPIWVRSITACPEPEADETAVVVARFIDELTGEEVSVNASAVRSDGHWDVTLVAPEGGLGDGTVGYLVEAQCVSRPHTEDAEVTLDQKYELRRMEVTSGEASGSGWLDGEVGGEATTTTTTTTTTVATSTTDTTGVAGVSTAQAVTSPTDVQQKSLLTGASSEEIRAELLAKAAIEEIRLASDPADYVRLSASPASAGRDQAADGGIPAWAFLCAAVRAVGAVIAYGNRQVAPVEVSAAIERSE